MSNEPYLTGYAASPGTVTGQVLVVTDPFSEVSVSTDNTILVAPYFTPVSLTKFVDAEAMVTDHGGMTSHAAVVAREMGVPCVTATEKATELLSDGDIIQVNGANGEIRLVDQ